MGARRSDRTGRRTPTNHVKGLPKLDRVTYRFIPDPNAALAALKAGDVDATMFGLGPEHIPDLQEGPALPGDRRRDDERRHHARHEQLASKPFTDVRVAPRLRPTGINKPEVLKGAMFGYGQDPRLQRGSAESVLRRRVQAPWPTTRPRPRSSSPRPAIPNGFEAVFKVAPQYFFAGALRRGGWRASSPKVGIPAPPSSRSSGAGGSPRSSAWRPARPRTTTCRIIGHAEAWDIRQLRQPEVLLPLGQRRLPGALPGARESHGGRQEAHASST